MTIDEKLLEKAFNTSTELKISGDRKVCDGIYIEDIAVIKYSDAKQIIHEALKKQREILIEDKSFELAQDNYVEDGVDYREDMLMIDLAHDSFAHGYFYAMKRLKDSPEPEI